jgi:hypothetical protein
VVDGIDVSGTVEVSRSSRKIAVRLGGSIAIAIVGALFAVKGWTRNVVETGIMYTAAALFAVFAVAYLRILLLERGPVYVLSPEGLKMGREFVPWNKVVGLRDVTYRKQSFLYVQLDPEFEATLPRFNIGGLNKALGFSRMWLTAAVTEMSYGELVPLVTAYWKAYSGRDKALVD